jgi:hypothetical protein
MKEQAYGVEQQRVQINFNNLTPFVDFGFAYGTLAGRSARVKTAQRSALSVFAFKRCPR